jgi:hypothetical protein
MVTSTVPQPPIHTDVADAVGWVGIGASLLALVAFVCWASYRAARHRDPLPLVVVVGSGALCALNEPIADVLGALWLSTDLPGPSIETLRSVPAGFVVPGWVIFFGAPAYLVFRLLSRGWCPSRLWRLYVLFMLADVAAQVPAAALDVSTYYGNQPLQLLGFPLWWTFANAAAPITAGALLFVLRPSIRGWRYLLLLALVPAAYGGVFGAITWPTVNALHTTLPWPATWAAGLVTCGLGVVVVLLTVRLVEFTQRTQHALSGTGQRARGPDVRGHARMPLDVS